MARYTGPACRLCRREGTKLFLKGTRCLTEKCAVERRPYPAGQHGNTMGRGRKQSEYAKQLREKQKVKRMYGLTETQFRNTYVKASTLPGVKGTNLLVALETRLDNIVYRMGFAASRRGARQLVRHGHVEVNGRKVDIPSFKVVPGMEVRVAPADREMTVVMASIEQASRGAPVSWLSIDSEKAAGRLLELPTRDGIPVNAQEQLIVELYSK
ncbi:MAG: 30S ribosomal protein S4 [Gemmatimonadetes bacterium]|nr:30S ribosomal protein S4 [Gemmatimonadota bacterium]MCA9762341.1 30S ribosomal protein S4 [Gemmatimonadota bacterium]MCB9517293.1 30S ribosomal protein S4 [Gemmatimonadales bacterium]HPF60469.1 30S ribosomal protein S4 [Gemmatimonadales bacterium]HRX18465.1 30S ribosomal protein S4 [Gemmatimonadales bacterium]